MRSRDRPVFNGYVVGGATTDAMHPFVQGNLPCLRCSWRNNEPRHKTVDFCYDTRWFHADKNFARHRTVELAGRALADNSAEAAKNVPFESKRFERAIPE